MSRHTSHAHRQSSQTALVALAFVAATILAPTDTASAQEGTSPPPTPSVKWAPGQKGKVEGPIMLRSGDELLVRQESSNDVSNITLTDQTKIESPSGLLNIDRKRQSVELLAPGLYIKVRGQGGDRGNLVAERISFHKGAVKVQNQIAAGEVELKARQAELAARMQANVDSAKAEFNAAKVRLRDSIDTRITNLDSYDVKFNTTVNFATGSAMLNDESKQALDNIAANASGLKGYLFEVAGYTDNTGSHELNQRLSARRVEAVVSYLTEKHNVPLRRIVNPTGLGSSHPVANNDTAEGRAMNRRVDVKILQNRGIQESEGGASPQ